MSKIKLKHILPFLIVVAISALFTVAFFLEPKKIPSALIGKAAPITNLHPLEGLTRNSQIIEGVEDKIMRSGKVSLVNIWASWCTPCRKEHPIIMELAKNEKIQLIGFNYKDQPANALRFLSELGNPYDYLGTDVIGRELINWGVYGVPETFILDGDGIIRYKFVGPLSKNALKEELLPIIDKYYKP